MVLQGLPKKFHSVLHDYASHFTLILCLGVLTSQGAEGALRVSLCGRRQGLS